MSLKTFAAAVAAFVVLLFSLAVFGSGEDPVDTNCLPTPARGIPAAPGSVVFPLREGSYQLSSPFGPRGGEEHKGSDLAAPIGTPIYSATDGEVRTAGVASGFGQWIIVDATIGGQTVSQVYGHMYPDGVLVKAGDKVAAGQHIANVGNNGVSSGPHLHFEVWPGGRLDGGEAIDPMPWLSRSSQPSPGTEADIKLAATINEGPSRGVGCGQPIGGSGLNVEALLADFPQAAPFVPWIQKFAGKCAETTAPIVAAQIRNESGGFQIHVTNPDSGAQGPTQFLPATWAQEGIDGDGDGKADPFNVADAVASQVSYDCKMADLARKDLASGKVTGDITELMLSYYNCGPGRSQETGGVCRNTETQNYVKDIPKWAQKWSAPTGGSLSGGFGDKVVEAARRWLGTPYAWGGGDEFGPTKGIRDGGVADSFGDFNKVGFDCSGLVRYAVAAASGGTIILPHQDQSQIDSAAGTAITSPADLRPGDIIQPHGGHIFIWIGNDTVIEAPQSGDVVKESHWVPPTSGLKAKRFG
ncbi:peptidoglycan DD-metalloendopeptidase family protein [Rhodococcus hoagii]|nr:peptidoglycan DD-metalloendopeptidase family protein [Prescottella equi]